MQIQPTYKRYVIDVNKSTHVAWWAEMLKVTEDALLEAIDRVGNEVHAVEAYLSNRRTRGQYH
jgi:hypothetical protein